MLLNDGFGALEKTLTGRTRTQRPGPENESKGEGLGIIRVDSQGFLFKEFQGFSIILD